MQNEEDRKWLYGRMKNAGVNTGSYDDFCKSLDDDGDRAWYYDKAKSIGLNVGTSDDFDKMMYSPKPVATPVTAATTGNKPKPTTENQATQENRGSRFSMPKPGDYQIPTVEEPVDSAKPLGTAENAKQESEREARHREMRERAVREQVGDMTNRIDNLLDQKRGEATHERIDRMQKAADKGLGSSFMEAMSSTAGAADPTDIQALTRTKSKYGNEDTPETFERGQQIRQLEAAQRSMRDAQRIINEADHNAKEGTLGKWLESSFAGGAARGFGQKLFDADTWDMGGADLSDNLGLMNALKKADKGEKLNEAEKMLLDAKAVELATNAYFGSYVGRGYDAGKVTAESIPFMIEMCINPASAAGEGAQSMLARYALKRFGKQTIKNNAKKYLAGKVATRVAGDIAGSAAMAGTTGLVRTTADATRRASGDVQFDADENGKAVFSGHTEGESFGKAFLKAYGATTIENYSEMFGAYFEPITAIGGKYAGKALNKIGLGKVNDFIENVAASDVAKVVGDFEKHAKWNGMFSEYAEEVSGNIMNALVVGDQTFDTDEDTGIFNLDNNIDTFLGVALMGGFFSGVKTLGYRGPKHQARKDMFRSSDIAEGLFGDKTWNDIYFAIMTGSDERGKQKVSEVLSDDTYNWQQKNALLHFVKDAEKYKGILAAEQSRHAEDPASVETDTETSYENGYSLQDSEEKQDANNMYDYKRQQMEESFGDEYMQMLDDNPLQTLREIHGREDISDEDKQLALDFVNAKATRDGMLDKVRDDIDGQVDASNRTIDMRVNNQSGTIVPAILKKDDRQVYIVDGSVSMLEDNSMVDVHNSSESVLVRDAQTGNLEWLAPSDFLSVEESIDPVVLKENVAEAIRTEIATEAANAIDGTLAFNVGDEYQLLSEDNQSHTARILAVNTDEAGVPDGTVMVSIDGAPEVNMAKETVQQLHNNVAMARLKEFEQQKALGAQGVGTPAAGTGQANAGSPLNAGDMRASIEQLVGAPVQQTGDSYIAGISNGSVNAQGLQRGANGEPVFEGADAGQIVDYFSSMEPEDAEAFIGGYLEGAKEILAGVQSEKPAETPKPKPSDYIGRTNQYLIDKKAWEDNQGAAAAEWENNVANAQAEVDKWQKVSDMYKGLQVASGAEGVVTPAAQGVGTPAAGTGQAETPAAGPEISEEDKARNAMVEYLRKFFEETGIDAALIDKMSDEEMQELISLIESWEEVNDVLGETQTKFGRMLKSKSESVAALAKKNIEKAEKAANDAFVPVEEYVNGLLQKYGLAEEAPEAPADNGTEGAEALAATVAAAEQATDQEPTEAQKKAGNYKKGHVKVDGFDITIENPKGSVRSGKDADGNEWSVTMNNTYGYIRGTEGVDGDHIDIFLSDEPSTGNVFVIDQVNADGSFDEHKVMYGFASAEEARAAYLANYAEGWTGLGAITEVTKDEFKKWIESSRRKTKPFTEYKNVKVEGAQNGGVEGVGTPLRTVTPLNDEEVAAVIDAMKAHATVAPTIEITDDNWKENIETPIGNVKMGAHQKEKLFAKGRESQYGMLVETLSNPDIVLEEMDKTENLSHERPSSYLFIKTFQKADGSKYVHFESVTVSQEGMEISVSSHIIREQALEKKLKNSNVIYELETLFPNSSEMHLAEHQNDVSDLLPTQGNNVSKGKGSNNIANGKEEQQEVEEKNDNADNENNNTSDAYTISPAEYTTKRGKKLDMKLVTFGAELSKEQMNAAKKLAKDLKGWWSKDDGGFLMRDEESAKKLADTVLNDTEAVADAQPVSLNDMRAAAETEGVGTPVGEEAGGAQEVEAAHTEEKKGSGNRLVTDERYEELKKRMKDKLKGNGRLMASAIGIDPEMLAIGTEMAVYHIEKGARKFIPYAKAMIEDLGDAVRPYLKAFYNGARDLPEVEANGWADELTPYDEVRKVDVANFDKQSVDAMATADMVVKETQAEKQADEVKEQIVEQRNNNRQDEKTGSDTAAIAEEAGAVASEAERAAETGSTEQLNEQVAKIDEALEKVNKQLALLGYYEADTSDVSKFHESYGYMRTAEKKAVKDVEKLAKAIASNLGVELGRKKIVQANIAPAGGDVYFHLPLTDNRNLYVNIQLDTAINEQNGYADDLRLRGIMYRIEDQTKSGTSQFVSNNNWLGVKGGLEEFISDIRSLVKHYAPDFEAKPVEKTMPVSPKKKVKDVVISPGQKYKVGDHVMYKNFEVSVESVNSDGSLNLQGSAAAMGLNLMNIKPGDVRELGSDESQEFYKKEFAKHIEKNNLSVDDCKKLQKEIEKQYDSIRERYKDQETVSAIVMEQLARFMGMDSALQDKIDNKVPSSVKSKNNSVSLQQGNQSNKSKENGNNNDLQARSTEEGRGGQRREQNAQMGGSPGNEAEGSDRSGMGGRNRGNSVSDAERSGRVPVVSEGKQGVKSSAKSEVETSETVAKNTNNNRGQRGKDYAPKGVDGRIEANIKAIELMQQLVESGKQATPAQMKVLRQFSGWGGLGKAFNERPNGPFGGTNPIVKKLRELLGDDVYRQAEDSKDSAFYTPAAIIDTMWDIARALGFKGGNILEGSAGIGNIIGQMPADMSEKSNIHAVEIDDTTGNILKLLYPDAKVEIQGFEQSKIPNGSVDLAITNVPFVTGLHVKDESGDGDLSKKFRDIHDFCIAKNVRKLREGGIGIFITSSGTLDNSQKLRNWLVNEGNADVIGAFRLNKDTFGGASVTSDIIVVRKRVNGQKSNNAIDVSTTTSERAATYKDEQQKGKERTVSMDYNKFYIDHPEFMAGEMHFGFEKGDNYRATSRHLYPVKGKNQAEMLAEWVKHFEDMKEEAASVQAAVAENGTSNDVVYEDLGEDVKEGSLVLDKDDKLCVAQFGKAVPLGLNANKVKGHTKKECFQSYQAIKSALSDVLTYQTENEGDAGLKPLLAKLNKAFDDFVKAYGHLHKNTSISFLKNDVDFPNVLALEKYSEEGDKKGNKIVKFEKTDIFSRRVVEKDKAPEPKNVKDGIIASIYQYGRVDVPYIASALGRSEEDVKAEIIESGLGFEDPATMQMEVSYQYLSGNVREKLQQAQEANEGGKYDANIEALRKVIPMDIPAHLIDFTLGSSWVGSKLYEDYIKERTDVDVKLTNVGGTWHMKSPHFIGTEKNKAMGIRGEVVKKLVSGTELIEAALQNKSIEVSEMHTVGYGSSKTTEKIVDKEATQACSAKIDEIRADFKDWARQKMQTDPELSARIERIYNDQFNNYVPVEVSEEFIPKFFSGANHKFEMRPHQSKAIIRGTMQPLMLAHEVGTGKTFTLISTAMEMRRLGTAKKPMIVVQNATVGQFVASAKELYPNAKVLTLEDKDHTGEGRRNFYAKIKYNDWDMIVVPQSVFERIPDSEERQMRFIQDKIEEKLVVLEKMKEADDDPRNAIVRQAEKEIEQLMDQLGELGEAASTKRKQRDSKREHITRQNTEVKAKEMLEREVDDVEDFDDMGIDAILVDEAHEYKHLGFATAMQRGVKGIDPSYSKKSQGVYLKTQAVLEKNNGRNVIFATGTPISNTAAEIWTFMRYLMPADTMKEYGIYYFDDFVRNFGNLTQMLEFTTSGKFKENNRFAGYVNLPELVRIWSSVADTVRTEEAKAVKDNVPEIEGGQAQDIYLPQTPALRGIMKYVKAELDRFDKMSGKAKKENSHIPLTMYGIAKAAAVDARLVSNNAEDDPNSKTNEAVRQTLRSLKDTKKYNGTVALFADNYQNKRSGFNLYEDIREKLIKEGVPAEQIAIIRSGMTIKKKQDIFDKVNRGEIRVIMGSTFTLGTGVNIQERLHTLIHLDAPNRPMDYTQRNGRIVRQGNLHKTMGIPVRVLRFGVQDSLDVTAYQRLKTKGAIADSIMKGKSMMKNSMEDRAMEEDEDVFGDTVAQLSGSQYAMLKNQAEREVRKYESKKKQWEADQTYVHNAIPSITGRIENAEARAELYKKRLATVNEMFGDNKRPEIKVGKLSFADVDAMHEFFTEYNKKVHETEEALRTAYGDKSAKRDIDIQIGGLTFTVTLEQNKETVYAGGGSLDTRITRRMTYSCKELNMNDEPVRGARLKQCIEDILKDIVSGDVFEYRYNSSVSEAERLKSELELVKSREGQPFQFTKELQDAYKRFDEYNELMKQEMEEKEKKYAEMDNNVSAASDITEASEEDEDSAEGVMFRMDDVPETSEDDGDLRFSLRERAAREKIDSMCKKLHIDDMVTLLDDNAGLKGKKAKAKGWYDTKTGKITIVLGNHSSLGDVMRTILHEAVAHHGLRKLFGANFDTFLDNVFRDADPELRRKIVDMAKKYGWDFRKATEEYLATLAEDTDFENCQTEHQGWWDKVKEYFFEMLKTIGYETHHFVGYIGDNELRYLLWRSYENLTDPGKGRNHFSDVFNEAKDIVKQDKLQVGNFANNEEGNGNWAAEDTLYREGEDEDEEGIELDRPLSLQESIMQGLMDLANKNASNAQYKLDVVKSIGGKLSQLNKAMSAQKAYDRTTVSDLVGLAHLMMKNNLLDNMTKSEIKRLFNIIKRATGKKDITGEARKMIDILVQNQARNAMALLGQVTSVRGSKVNASGVEVQGALSIDGQKRIKYFREAVKMNTEAIKSRLEVVSDLIDSEDKVTADNAAIEYGSLVMALNYMENVKDKIDEEKNLKKQIKDAAALQKDGRMTREAYKEFVESINDAILQSKLERIDALYNLATSIAGVLRTSIAEAKEFKQREKDRVNNIHHLANSDMQGRPANEHVEDDWKKELSNGSAVRFVLKPLGTFEQMLKLFGNKAVNGEGYLYNYFMRGWVNASEREFEGFKKSCSELDDKVSEVFGKKMRWSDLYSVEAGMPKVSVSFWDGDKMRDHELTQGNLLYMYMVDKMADGRMKLRKMGVTEEDMQNISEMLDPRFKTLADWLQSSFLVKKRNNYNLVYERMFGAPMAAIDNYFPLKILSNARTQEVDLADSDYAGRLSSTVTGSVIKRQRNTTALDITGADAFSVVVEHLQSMEHWAAFAELNRDMNTLLSYKRFHNQCMNMSTIYGAGQTLFDNFVTACKIASGEYQPVVTRDSIDKTFVNVAKGVTVAKISFRIFTALKQLLSFPAYLADASFVNLGKSMAKPWEAWNWAMEELPLFAKRWESKQAGDSRLLQTDLDWRFWRNEIVQKLSRWGMSPNAFVDALTVAMGAKAIYETKKAQYLEDGFTEEHADKKAKQDAAISVNQTQQSSENAFLSSIQLDRTAMSVALSVFRNSSMGYQRRLVHHIRTLYNMMKPGYKQQSIEFMAKQFRREGLSEESAQRAAERMYRREGWRALTGVATFGYLMQFAWNMGPYLAYLLFGDDDDDKEKMLQDAAMHALFGGIEGLTGGNMLSELANMRMKGESWRNYNFNLLPLMSDVQTIFNHFESDKVQAANDVVNLLVQAGIGVNPQTITDAAVAIYDACGEDAETSREATILITRLLSVPQSQIEKLYIDELGMRGKDATKLSYRELAERYARYKRRRGAALTQWAYSDEAEREVEQKYMDKFKKKVKERINSSSGNRELDEAYENLSEEYKKAQKEFQAIKDLANQGNFDEYMQKISDFSTSPSYRLYSSYGKYKHRIDELTNMALEQEDPNMREFYLEEATKLKAMLVNGLGGNAK